MPIGYDNELICNTIKNASSVLISKIIDKYYHNGHQLSNKKEKIEFIKNNNFSQLNDYVDFYTEISRSRINRSFFLQEIYHVLTDHSLIEEYNSLIDVILICILEDIDVEQLYEIYRLSKIEHYENREKYVLVLDNNDPIVNLDIDEFMNDWNTQNSKKIKINITEDQERFKINYYKETGFKQIYYFPNRQDVSVVEKKRLNPLVIHCFDLYKENNRWIAVANFKLNMDELSLKLLMYMFSQDVKIEKDLKEAIKITEQVIKESTSCRDLLSKVIRVRSDTISRINLANIEEEKKVAMLSIANTISLNGIQAKNQNLLKIDKYEIEGDMDYINRNNQNIIESINEILSSSEDYEIRMKIGRKTFGIVNGELKLPNGNLSENEFAVLNYVFM